MTARQVTKEGIKLIKKEREETKINCPYASTLIERFSFFYGRIGISCDSCEITDCEHNPKELNEKGIKNGYVFNYVEET